MKLIVDILFFLTISIITVPSDSKVSFVNLFNDPDFNPIVSIKFTVKEQYAICEAHSLLPVTYKIRVFNQFGKFAINKNVVDMEYGWGNYLIICEARISLDNSTWTKTTLLSYSFHVSKSFVRLFNGSKPNEGLIQFYYAGEWRHPCDDNFADNEGGRKNGKVVCKELGFPGVDVMKSDGAFGTHKAFFMDNVVCVGSELSLKNCSSTIGSNAHDCGYGENAAGVICLRKSTQNKFVTLNIISFRSIPAQNLDINEHIEIVCVLEVRSEAYFHIELSRIKGSTAKIDPIFDINSNISIVSSSKTSTKMSIKYLHTPDKKYATDTFICQTTDATSGLVERKELFLQYNYPIERLSLEPYTKYGLNGYAPHYLSNLSVAEEQDFKNASQIKCTGDYEVDNANFTWLYTGANGTNVVKGPILDLKNVERRLPLCCRVDHELRSGPYNISKCITIQELPETPIVRTSTFCGTRTLNVECPESTDMVFSSIHAGYANSCSQTDYDHCQHHSVTNFIREERCAENSCRIFAGLFKKSYFKPILASLPLDCLNETKPFVKMDYYCLDKFNSTVL